MTMRAVFDDPNDAPKADSTRYYKCDECENLHVLLVDENDMAICSAVISREMLVSMLEVIDGDPTMGQHGHQH